MLTFSSSSCAGESKVTWTTRQDKGWLVSQQMVEGSIHSTEHEDSATSMKTRALGTAANTKAFFAKEQAIK
eukprot:1141336-Pelagomonas_calceolata.AAC.5